MFHKFYAIVFCHSRENGNPDVCFYWIPASLPTAGRRRHDSLFIERYISVVIPACRESFLKKDAEPCLPAGRQVGMTENITLLISLAIIQIMRMLEKCQQLFIFLRISLTLCTTGGWE